MKTYWSAVWFSAVIVGMIMAIASAAPIEAHSRQDLSARRSLTPLQAEIERQLARLDSTEVDERRDAVARLGAMHHPDASRAALSALSDPLAIVRAIAATAILSLPGEESAASLIPLLSDKDEFVRREVAYALGKTRSQMAVAPLIERLQSDKKDSVRAAAAVALGQIRNPAAVFPLATVLDPRFGLTSSKKTQKNRKEANPFLLRAAAHSLGQIGGSVGLPALFAVLQNEKADDDVRREAAFALGMIGDPSALPALREAATARDPYLSHAAQEAIRRIELSNHEPHKPYAPKGTAP
jgi:HEAT repeat protein